MKETSEYTLETSFWLTGLDTLLNLVSSEWRQEGFDTYIGNKDIRRYLGGLRKIASKYDLQFTPVQSSQSV